MSDQQAMMAQQNPEMAQQFAMQNPQLAQQAAMQRPDVVEQIMPGAMAAASSGTNAPNVSPMSQAMNNQNLWKGFGGIGQMMQRGQQMHQYGALMRQAPTQMMAPGRVAPQQGGRPQMGALYQARQSRIY